MVAVWEDWAPPTSGSDPEIRGLLRAVMGLHSTFSNEIWLWRGQADRSYPLEPGMHTRIRSTNGLAMDERNVVWATRALLWAARQSRLDVVEDLRLPDLALLAHLQHHGAATPLLDVTVDPLVALWMVAHASGADPTAADGTGGILFAIRRPDPPLWLNPLDSRDYASDSTPDVRSALIAGVHWYRAPDISERLRIQRGSFLLGRLKYDGQTTLDLTSDRTGWLKRRIDRLGKPGQPYRAETDIVAFKVRPGLKAGIREWLSERAGLTQEVIYPTPWHRPFLEDFCRSHSRTRAVDLPSRYD